MGIKSPATYGDWYWKNSVEAQKLFAEETEKELSTISASLMGSLQIKEYLPPELLPLFSQLEAPAGAFLGDVGGRFVSEVADGAVSQAANPFFESMGYAANKMFHTKKILPPAAATLFSRKKISPELLEQNFLIHGFEAIEAKFQYDSMRPYPGLSDLILYSRYHGDPENVWTTLADFYDVDPVDFKVWEWLGKQRLSTGVLTKLLRRGLIEPDEFGTMMQRVGWFGLDIDRTLEDSWLLPNAMLLVQGDLQQGIETDKIISDISRADIHPDYAQKYLDAILTKPSSQDVIAYELRRDPELTNLPARLRQIGIHDDYTALYKTLAYQIPPVADIITMAVREAFTPEIAERFGQYEDYPPDLETWGVKKGLTAEWTKRYWAAHWSLPSPQQGFEMLHRGIIDKDELSMLLRALDVMPYWRDRLTEMAFRPLTRVDVRRMYREGILDETGVYEAYLDHGYSEKNAERMTEFTISYVLTQQARFTTGDVVAAFTKRMITDREAAELLRGLGVRAENANYIISTAEYKRDWALTESKITGIRNLYKRAVYDLDKTRDELSRLDLPAEQIDVLMEQWWYEDKTEPTANFTKAETLKFIKTGLITAERGRQELRELRFDQEHIDVYMRSIA